MEMESELAILMADLAGYTAMTDVHGGLSAGKLVGTFMQLVEQSLQNSARITQRIGDQVVITSASANDVAMTAWNLFELIHRQHQFLSLHAGLHIGMIHREGNNLFGSTINITSRIMNLAERGSILCSEDFLNRINLEPSFQALDKGYIKFKNVLKEIRVYELVPHIERESFYVDPVCHMQLDPSKQNIEWTWEGRKIYFCSDACLELFKAEPASFLK